MTKLSIGEFARLAGLPVKTLRYYADIGLFPASEVDSVTGYRRYNAAQLAPLNRILALKALGFPLERIRQLIDEPVDMAELRGMFLLRRDQLEIDLQATTSRLAEIDNRLHHINEEITMPAAILTKTVTAMTFAGAREVVPDHELMRDRCIALDAQACRTISRLKLRVDGPSCALYYPHDTGIDVEMGYPVKADDTATDDLDVHSLPALEVAYAVYTGSYDDFGAVADLHVALREWVSNRDSVSVNPVREIYLHPSNDPSQGVMEMQYPLQ